MLSSIFDILTTSSHCIHVFLQHSCSLNLLVLWKHILWMNECFIHYFYNILNSTSRNSSFWFDILNKDAFFKKTNICIWKTLPALIPFMWYLSCQTTYYKLLCSIIFFTCEKRDCSYLNSLFVLWKKKQIYCTLLISLVYFFFITNQIFHTNYYPRIARIQLKFLFDPWGFSEKNVCA